MACEDDSAPTERDRTATARCWSPSRRPPGLHAVGSRLWDWTSDLAERQRHAPADSSCQDGALSPGNHRPNRPWLNQHPTCERRQRSCLSRLA